MHHFHGNTQDAVVIKVDIDRPRRDLPKNRTGTLRTDWQSPLAQQFKIRSLPSCIICGADGRMLAEGETADQWLYEWTQ